MNYTDDKDEDITTTKKSKDKDKDHKKKKRCICKCVAKSVPLESPKCITKVDSFHQGISQSVLFNQTLVTITYSITVHYLNDCGHQKITTQTYEIVFGGLPTCFDICDYTAFVQNPPCAELCGTNAIVEFTVNLCKINY